MEKLGFTNEPTHLLYNIFIYQNNYTSYTRVIRHKMFPDMFHTTFLL